MVADDEAAFAVFLDVPGRREGTSSRNRNRLGEMRAERPTANNRRTIKALLSDK